MGHLHLCIDQLIELTHIGIGYVDNILVFFIFSYKENSVLGEK